MRLQIDLVVTAAAREELAFLARRQAFTSVPALLWAENRETGRSDWIVGFYDRARVPDAYIVEACGVELVIEHQWRDAAEGKHLALVDGRFVVRAMY